MQSKRTVKRMWVSFVTNHFGSSQSSRDWLSSRNSISNHKITSWSHSLTKRIIFIFALKQHVFVLWFWTTIAFDYKNIKHLSFYRYRAHTRPSFAAYRVFCRQSWNTFWYRRRFFIIGGIIRGATTRKSSNFFSFILLANKLIARSPKYLSSNVPRVQ